MCKAARDGHANARDMRLNNMKTTMLAALALTACHPQVIAIPSTTDAPKPGQMAVTGTATLEVSPDCADLTMTLSSDDVRPAAATAHVDAKEQAVIAAMTKLGVTT